MGTSLLSPPVRTRGSRVGVPPKTTGYRGIPTMNGDPGFSRGIVPNTVIPEGNTTRVRLPSPNEFRSPSVRGVRKWGLSDGPHRQVTDSDHPDPPHPLPDRTVVKVTPVPSFSFSSSLPLRRRVSGTRGFGTLGVSAGSKGLRTDHTPGGPPAGTPTDDSKGNRPEVTTSTPDHGPPTLRHYICPVTRDRSRMETYGRSPVLRHRRECKVRLRHGQERVPRVEESTPPVSPWLDAPRTGSYPGEEREKPGDPLIQPDGTKDLYSQRSSGRGRARPKCEGCLESLLPSSGLTLAHHASDGRRRPLFPQTLM